jgi:hypothetical protein
MPSLTATVINAGVNETIINNGSPVAASDELDMFIADTINNARNPNNTITIPAPIDLSGSGL